LRFRYGGGPVFRRKVIEIRGQPQVETYLYSLKVTFMNRPEVVDTEDYKSAMPQIKAIKFDVSKKATIKELRQIFFEAFEISPEAASRLALFNYLDDTLGDVLEDYIDERSPSKTTWRDNGKPATVHSTRLVDTQSLLIDNKPEIDANGVSDDGSSGISMNATSGTDNDPSNPTSGALGSALTTSASNKVFLSLPELFAKQTAFPRGLCGLRNLGNTCFMNSALQCLSATEPLMQYFVSGKFETELNPTNPLGKGGELAQEFGRLVARMWSGKESSLVPRDFKWMLGNFAKRFDDSSQQDSQELLAFLLDGLHEDCNRVFSKPQTPSVDVSQENDQAIIQAADAVWAHYKSRNDSEIVDLFQAQLKSKLECPDCGHMSITFDPFMYLSLPIPTDSVRTREITFSFRGGLLKCALQLPRNSLMSQVKQQLTHLTGVSASRIVLADVHASKIHKKYHNTDRFDSVSQSDHLVAFELQYDISKPLLQKVVVPVYQRSLKPVWSKKDDRWGYAAACVGFPTFIVVDKHITYGDLYNTIKKQLHTFMDMGSLQVSTKRIPFTISKIKSDGSTLHPLEEYRGGSATSMTTGQGTANSAANPTPTQTHNLHIVIMAGDILSVDWDLSVVSGLQMMAPRTLPIKEHGQFAETMAAGQAIAAKPTTVEDCFKTFVKPEKLDGGNQWRCPVCKVDREATKTISIWTLPEVLVVHLKRFTETIWTRQKLNNLIHYPLYELDVAPYLAPRPAGTHDDRMPLASSTKYDLYAVSNHYGGLGGGHYTATARNFVDGHWYDFDDASITRVTDKDVVSPAAYVLFYKRRDTSATSSKL
jgi:ubiquitin carboxyl-terminal hydrolase 4/11/15